MIGIVLGLIWFLVVLNYDINSDFKRLETNSIKHSRGLIYRSLGLIPTFFCYLLPINNMTFIQILLLSIVIIGLIGSVWWELFDGLLNLKRKKSWRYNGSDDTNDACADNILQKLKSKQQTILKWSLIILFLIFFIIFKNKFGN